MTDNVFGLLLNIRGWDCNKTEVQSMHIGNVEENKYTKRRWKEEEQRGDGRQGGGVGEGNETCKKAKFPKINTAYILV